MDDLIEVSFVDRGYIRHNYMAKYNKNFRFCYLGGMRIDEMCIFKVFDSKDGVAKGKPLAHVFLYFRSQAYLRRQEFFTAPSDPSSLRHHPNRGRALSLDC